MKVLEEKMQQLVKLGLAKFVEREAKHPAQSSVTHDDFDWAGQNLEDIEHHMVYEFLERFPQFIERFPEVDKSKITIDPPEEEDRDLFNLSFLDWACREARRRGK